jgi:DNA-3-methyladenine glycosylase
VIDPFSRPGGAADLFAGSVFEVAPRLLGCRLRTAFGRRPVEVMLTEVEAYAGGDDPASHAFRGKTKRNAAMFEAAGTLYVYRSYGLHWCMNVVVGPPDLPHAVLLRSGQVTEGAAVVQARRGRRDHLTDGPGKLAEAVCVTGAHDGTSLVTGPVRLGPGARPPGSRIVTTPRIGITKAAENPWRYVLIQ